MGEILYHVRVAAPSEPEDAYVGRMAGGLPVWSWSAPPPLPLGLAEILRRDALRLCGGTLYLEPVESIPATIITADNITTGTLSGNTLTIDP